MDVATYVFACDHPDCKEDLWVRVDPEGAPPGSLAARKKAEAAVRLEGWWMRGTPLSRYHFCTRHAQQEASRPLRKRAVA